MSNVIQIQSKVTISVTSGLQHDDVTNADAHIPDRLKVSPTWPKNSILIKEGVGIYPADLANWPSVKALIADKIITISTMVDESETAKVEDIAKVQQVKAENVKKLKEKAKSLTEIAGDN